ncbi:MAG: TetR/AcrR family transcriptional regulator [Lachnospiraceae bacterium]|nr:TetR/AcrR family transcriptional regulator [Lachnospiraceae bacterium]
MGERSLQKKQFILEKAKEVFVEKGFRSVTMKDIVDACEISRGGLYLYYGDTEQIFLEVLAADSEKTEDVFEENVGEDATAAEILAVFLKEQKKEILGSRKTLAVAAYEYAFANPKSVILKKRFNKGVTVLEKLIKMGAENGAFYDVDARVAAKNVMYVLEGLKIAAVTIGISGEAIDQELYLIMQGLIIEEEGQE